MRRTRAKQGSRRESQRCFEFSTVEETMNINSFKVLLISSLLVVASASLAFANECIAPANPGGGWDFTCRQIGKVMYDLGAVDKPIQVTNMAGAGGGLAYNHVVAERNDDEELIIAASSATTGWSGPCPRLTSPPRKAEEQRPGEQHLQGRRERRHQARALRRGPLHGPRRLRRPHNAPVHLRNQLRLRPRGLDQRHRLRRTATRP